MDEFMRQKIQKQTCLTKFPFQKQKMADARDALPKLRNVDQEPPLDTRTSGTPNPPEKVKPVRNWKVQMQTMDDQCNAICAPKLCTTCS
jgi:hypothetical protein